MTFSSRPSRLRDTLTLHPSPRPWSVSRWQIAQIAQMPSNNCLPLPSSRSCRPIIPATNSIISSSQPSHNSPPATRPRDQAHILRGSRNAHDGDSESDRRTFVPPPPGRAHHSPNRAPASLSSPAHSARSVLGGFTPIDQAGIRTSESAPERDAPVRQAAQRPLYAHNDARVAMTMLPLHSQGTRGPKPKPHRALSFDDALQVRH
ncbi:hypothetical protein OH76DRAFT_903835 [Lentinus brumalis]|uniref:Uncharacterized protein n=1 Tax=Lentinus brumalis TaxID=2498619 RepID=A0A371D0E4_9APHY|nr:hypothetical protein OH76DRAFT_903835 [Polyporus brumalis]